jgi:hypothetical protein
MKKKSFETIKKLVEDIERLRTKAAKPGFLTPAINRMLDGEHESIQKNLAAKGVAKPDGSLDEPAWEKLEAHEKEAVWESLVNVKAAILMAIQAEGPAEDGHIMFHVHASNTWIIALTTIAVAATIAVLLLVCEWWPYATGTNVPPPQAMADSPERKEDEKGTGTSEAAGKRNADSAANGADAAAPGAVDKTDTGKDVKSSEVPAGPSSADPLESARKPAGTHPSEVDVLVMVILMGTLGGLVHLTSSLAKYVGNRQLLRSWIIYYLLMPLEGASVAPMVYLLLRVGVLSPTNAGGSTANLNLVGIYAFAGLTGLFSKQAIDMLAEVFNTIFTKIKAKDPLDKDKKPSDGKTHSESPGESEI